MIKITTGDFLIIDFQDGSETVELTKWVCDKIHDKLLIRSATGDSRVFEKGEFDVDGNVTSDLSVVRAAVGANW